MSISFLAALAGTVAGLVGTVMLIRRTVATPRIDMIAWVIALAGVTIALAAQAMGYERGFGPLTFRAVQIGGALIGPIALVWGMSETAAKSLPGRFFGRLVVSALFIVSIVVLATDPLSSQSFSKAWPAASLHYQVIPKYLLTFLAIVAVLGAVIALAVTGLHRRRDPNWPDSLIVVGLAAGGAIVLLALHVSLPVNSGYAAACVAAAVLAYFAGDRARRLRLSARPRPADTGAGSYHDDDSLGLYYPRSTDGYRETGYGRRASSYGGRDSGGYPVPSDTSGYPVPSDTGGFTARDGGGGYAAEEDTGGFAAGDDTGGFAAGDDTGGFGFPGDTGGFGMPAESGGFEVPAGTSGFGAPGASGGFLPYPGAGEYDGPDTDAGVPVTGTFDAVLAGATGDDPADPAALAAPAGSVPADTERLYGQIAIYTLLDEGAEEFDQLSTRVVEQVQAKERGTLVYVVHGVPSAPLQRILYEVYRDRAAYDEHTRQPYIADFKSQCKPLVLATNVIELGVMQAKMSLLAAERDAAARNAAGRDRR